MKRQAFNLMMLAAIGITLASEVNSVSAAATSAPPTADMVTVEGILKSPKTQHTLSVGRINVSYTAWFEETLLYDEQHRPQASVSATSYMRNDTKNAQDRPVLFAFNGGPGASSTPLHFNAFGPKRFEQDGAGARRLVDNEFGLLDAADLVFIDPVGTGFSRERLGAVSGIYFAPREDAIAALGVIRQWLRDNGRTQSPLFIAGESYGGFRAALMMRELKDMPLSGLILISPALDMSAASGGNLGNDLPFILDFPSMAIAAWEHRRIDRASRSLTAVFDDASTFAQSDYALALLKGSAITSSERHQLAQRMSSFIGLPVETIERANLRVDSQAFLEQLMEVEDKIVGRLDTRVVAPKPGSSIKPDRPAAANDPALGLGTSNVIKSESAKRYFEKELKVKTARDYLALSLDVNFRWNWCELLYDMDPKDPSFYLNPTSYIADIMNAQPKMRLLVVGGVYDMAVPLLAPRYALTHAGVPLERVSIKALAGPHSVFEGRENLREGSDLVHAFLRGEEP
jgi:carboxypeptidase C (cathepsin A)